MVSLFELIKYGKCKLENSNTPQLDAEVILSHVLKKDRIYLYTNRDMKIDEASVNEFNRLIERRAYGEPIQYITGVKEFMGLDFCVRQGVLIPRGDTEILVEEVIKIIKDIKNPVVVDVGCGSGAIAVSIAKYVENAEVYALDIMDIPLEVTAANANENGVGNRVQVIKSDLLGSLDKKFINKIDLIVSNPPYIEDDIIKTLDVTVKDFEPFSALSGGVDGLDFYRKITIDSVKFLKNNGLLAYEIGYNQRKAVTEIMASSGFNNIECLRDLGGNDRVVLGYVNK